MKLNLSKKFAAGLITTSILVSNVSMAFADNNTSKEEVVYTKLNYNGEVNNIYVINSFDTSSNKNIIDYGNYSNVVNLSTEDILKYSNGLINTKVSDKEGKFFYQGDMKDKDIPWNINIEYTLNGQKINAKDLAGKNGKLEIKIDITKNDKIDKVFYDNYAIQLSLSLDEEKCKKINAEGGTIVTVGSTKSISYIKLPGENASYTLTSDVNNFEMDPIIINGLNMGMNINVDLGDMNNSLDTLVNAVGDLNKGTSSLKVGLDNYKIGVNKFNNGSTQLLSVAEQLKNGVNEFKGGVLSLNDGAKSLNDGLESLSQGSSNYKQNVDNYADSVSKIVNELKANLPEEMYQQLPLDSLVVGAQGLANGYEDINNGINSSKNGLKELYNGSQKLSSNISALSQGSEGLYNGIVELSNGSNKLVNSMDKIGEGALRLNDGTTELNNKTSDIPNVINSKIKKMTSKYSNSNFKPVSFVSEKNDNIESVQFTIRTENISIEEKESIVKEEKKEDNFLEMFLNIFKKEK